MNRRDAAITTLRSDNTTLKSAVATVNAERDNAWNTIAQMEKENAELRRQLGIY